MPIRYNSLTPGERVWLARQLRNLTAAVAARRLGRAISVLRAMERDGRDPKLTLTAAARLAGHRLAPTVLSTSRKPLDPNMRCRLARRRSGLSLDEVARALGVTKPTVLEREKTGELCAYWNA